MVNFLKFCLLIFTIIPLSLFAQNLEDLDFVLENNPYPKQQEENLSFDFNQENELTFATLTVIRFYQNFVSSQQSPRICTFEPSCSRFGHAAIKVFGPIIGILLAGDRMQRCYPANAEYYKTLLPNGKYRDNVRSYEKYIKK